MTASEAIKVDVARAVADPARGDFDDPRKMRRVNSVDPETGLRMTTWHGQPTWMKHFAPPILIVKSIDARDERGNEIPPAMRWIGPSVPAARRHGRPADQSESAAEGQKNPDYGRGASSPAAGRLARRAISPGNSLRGVPSACWQKKKGDDQFHSGR